jgi:hypothetical protein
MKALQQADLMRLSKEEKLALLLHDIGKPGTAKPGKKGGLMYYAADQSDPTWQTDQQRAKSHQQRGAEIAEQALTRMAYPKKTIQQVKEMESENKKLLKIQSVQQEHIDNLKNALKPDSFDGFFPICSNCKDIRDPKGYWHSIEEYIQSLSEADLSHSLCPECAKKLYPDLFDGNNKAICLKWKTGSDTPM